MGCSSTTKRRGGAGLSEAAGEARKETEEQEPVLQGPRVGFDEEGQRELTGLGVVTAWMANQPPSAAEDPRIDQTEPSALDRKAHPKGDGISRHNLLLGVFGSSVAGDDLQDGRGLTLKYSAYSGRRLRLGFGLYGAWLNAGTDETVSEGLHRFRELGFDGSVGCYFTHDKTLMGLYGIAGLRWGFFRWDYRNPLAVIGEQGGDDTVTSDRLGVLSLYVPLRGSRDLGAPDQGISPGSQSRVRQPLLRHLHQRGFRERPVQRGGIRAVDHRNRYFLLTPGNAQRGFVPGGLDTGGKEVIFSIVNHLRN